MEIPDAVKYPIQVGPNPQPDIRKAKVVIINNVKYKVLVGKDNPCFASVWTFKKNRWSKLPFHVTFHLLLRSDNQITTDNPNGNRDPVYTCDCHGLDSLYRPTGYICPHILAAQATGMMVAGQYTNKSFPTAQQMLES